MLQNILKYLKMIRKGDVVIILLLMLGSFLPLGFFTYQHAQAEQNGMQAIIQVDGEILKVFELVDDGKTESYLYEDEHGHENLIVRTGTSIQIQEASCRDQICVRMHAIEQSGETILCLPHRLLVKVQSKGEEPTPTEDALDIIS